MRVSFTLSLIAALVIDQSQAVVQRSWLNSAVFLHGLQDPVDDVDHSECSCSCCEVVERTPEEIKIQSIYLKCAQKFTDVGEECSNKCKITNNVVLPAGTSDKGINYDRFCFYYCQPFDTEVTGPCIRQNGTEQLKAGTKSGNGEDLHLPPQGQGDIIKPNPPTPPPEPPTMKEMPCRERKDCIETLMGEARNKAGSTWEMARAAAEAARKAANGGSTDTGSNIGAWDGNPAPGVITALTPTEFLHKVSLVDNLQDLEAISRSGSHLKISALEVIVGQLDESKKKNLKDIFKKLDGNGDGVLSASELKGGLQEAGVKEDIPSDLQEISYTYFLAATVDKDAYMEEDVLQDAFKIFDQNGNSKISLQELHDDLESGVVPLEENVEKESSGSAGFTGNAKKEAHDDAIKELMKEAHDVVDTNGDGSIDFQEFKAMMGAQTSAEGKTAGSPSKDSSKGSSTASKKGSSGTPPPLLDPSSVVETEPQDSNAGGGEVGAGAGDMGDVGAEVGAEGIGIGDILG